MDLMATSQSCCCHSHVLEMIEWYKKASALFFFVYICIVMQQISSCSDYRIEIMHVYYIAMEIFFFFFCTNIFSPFYSLYVIIISHHFITIYFTQS